VKKDNNTIIASNTNQSKLSGRLKRGFLTTNGIVFSDKTESVSVIVGILSLKADKS